MLGHAWGSGLADEDYVSRNQCLVGWSRLGPCSWSRYIGLCLAEYVS
jgi:hypothetical protein